MLVEMLIDFADYRRGQRYDLPDDYALVALQTGIARPLPPQRPTPGKQVLALLDPALTRSRKGKREALFGPAATGDPDHSFSDWLWNVAQGNAKVLAERYGSLPADDIAPASKAALTTQTGVHGGYLVPEEFLDRLLHTRQDSIVWPRALIVPMTAPTIDVPLIDATTPPTVGDASFFGGLVGRWTQEGVTVPETEPRFRAAQLRACELLGTCYLSNALLQSMARPLEPFLLRVFGECLIWFQESAFLIGNGAGQPLGVRNAACALAVTRTAAADFVLLDAAAMVSRLLPGHNPETTCWVVHPTVKAKLFLLAASAPGAIALAVVNDRPRIYLLGYPVEVSDALPALGSAGDVILADWSYYLIGDRNKVDIAYSSHQRFTTNQGLWRLVSRVDGQPWLNRPVTLADGSSQASAFVYLS